MQLRGKNSLEKSTSCLWGSKQTCSLKMFFRGVIFTGNTWSWCLQRLAWKCKKLRMKSGWRTETISKFQSFLQQCRLCLAHLTLTEVETMSSLMWHPEGYHRLNPSQGHGYLLSAAAAQTFQLWTENWGWPGGGRELHWPNWLTETFNNKAPSLTNLRMGLAPVTWAYVLRDLSSTLDSIAGLNLSLQKGTGLLSVLFHIQQCHLDVPHFLRHPKVNMTSVCESCSEHLTCQI